MTFEYKTMSFHKAVTRAKCNGMVSASVCVSIHLSFAKIFETLSLCFISLSVSDTVNGGVNNSTVPEKLVFCVLYSPPALLTKTN
jgi:hypothetical protein